MRMGFGYNVYYIELCWRKMILVIIQARVYYLKIKIVTARQKNRRPHPKPHYTKINIIQQHPEHESPNRPPKSQPLKRKILFT